MRIDFRSLSTYFCVREENIYNRDHGSYLEPGRNWFQPTRVRTERVSLESVLNYLVNKKL